MNRIVILTLGLSLAPVLCWAEEAKAIAEIEKLGGADPARWTVFG